MISECDVFEDCDRDVTSFHMTSLMTLTTDTP